jgi:hypothetical protein
MARIAVGQLEASKWITLSTFKFLYQSYRGRRSIISPSVYIRIFSCEISYTSVYKETGMMRVRGGN